MTTHSVKRDETVAQATVHPSVTVVVPTHNRPEKLKRAVAAILNQAYDGPIEVLVVFDKAESFDVNVEVPPNRTLRSIVNDRTPLLAGARNTGILEASGELVAFCDDDDYWLPGKLSSQVELLTSTAGAVMVGCGIALEYGDEVLPRATPRQPVTLTDLLASRVAELHPSTFLARRDVVLSDIGLIDEEIPGSYCEDYDWLLRAARIAPVPMVSEPSVRVTWVTGSMFGTQWDMVCAANAYLLDKHPEFATSPVGTARLQAQIAFAEAARGNYPEARRWAKRALRHSKRERRAYLAIAVSLRLISTDRVLKLAHSRGHGI